MSDLKKTLQKAYRHYILAVLLMDLKSHPGMGDEVEVELCPGIDGDPDHLLITIPGDLQFQVSVVPVIQEDPPTGEKPVRRPA